MKRLLALLIPVCFLSISLFGCGSDKTDDTSKPGANGSIIEPEDNNMTNNQNMPDDSKNTADDVLDDGKNVIDDVVDDAKKAADDVADGAKDMTEPNAAQNNNAGTAQNDSAGTANTTVQTPNK